MLGHGPHEAGVGCGHSGLLLPVHAPRRKTAVRACHARLSETYSRDSSHALCHRRAVWAGVLATVDHDSSLQVMRVWLNGFRLLLPVFAQLHAVSSAFSCKPARNLRRWSVGLRKRWHCPNCRPVPGLAVRIPKALAILSPSRSFLPNPGRKLQAVRGIRQPRLGQLLRSRDLDLQLSASRLAPVTTVRSP